MSVVLQDAFASLLRTLIEAEAKDLKEHGRHPTFLGRLVMGCTVQPMGNGCLRVLLPDGQVVLIACRAGTGR